MVSKAKSIKGSAKSIEYIQSDKELGPAIELDRNGIVSEDPSGILQEFRLMQEANQKCDKNTISIVISPSDERAFSNEELRDIGKHHLEKLGLSDHQYLMTKHGSTDHPHIHILANRIDEKGKALNDSHISLKSQTISENLSKELGLYTAKDWQKVRHMEQLPIKKEIENSHQYALQHSKNYTEYKDFMRGKGIDVIDTINKQGQLKGFKIKHLESGLDFKASEIKKGFGMKDLVLHQVKMPELSKPYQDIANSLSKLTSRGIDPTLLNPGLNIAKQIAETVIKKTISKGFGMGM